MRFWGVAILSKPEYTILKYTFFVDCGGVIELSEGYSTTVEYKVDETYGNNEFCMWGITSARRWGSLSVVIESHGFERCCDGVLAYYLNSTSAPGSVGVERCDL